MTTDQLPLFLQKFLRLPGGYRDVTFNGRRYGVSIDVSADGRRRKLFAEELGGTDHVSFNLYLLDGKPPLLKPCEMPAEKVINFVLSFEDEADAASKTGHD